MTTCSWLVGVEENAALYHEVILINSDVAKKNNTQLPETSFISILFCSILSQLQEG